MKENKIEYYPHKTNSHRHPKFQLLRAAYGWGGEGRFWALCNLIGAAEDCYLDISKGYVKASMLVEFGWNDDKQLEDFLEFLESKCELIMREGNLITTPTAQETLMGVMANREKLAERQKRFREKNKGQEAPKPAEAPKPSPAVENPKPSPALFPKEATNEPPKAFVDLLKLYPGTKGGAATEFTNFKKKLKSNWAATIPVILAEIERQKKERAEISSKGGFVPEWKMFQTYINKRGWEVSYKSEPAQVKPGQNSGRTLLDQSQNEYTDVSHFK